MNWLRTFTIVLSLFSTQTLAQDSEDYYAGQLSKFARERGIAINFDGELCEQNEIIAAWNVEHNSFRFCRERLALQTRQERMEAIKHETVHLIQDCRGGLDTPILVPIYDRIVQDRMLSFLPEIDILRLTEYPAEELIYEIEAYYLQYLHFSEIYQLLLENCE